MKMKLTHFMILILLASCGSKESVQNNSSSTTPVQTANNNPSPTPSYVPTSGGTGGSSSVVDGVTFYDQDDPITTVTLPGVAYNSCGTLYRVMNSGDLIFEDSSSGSLFDASDYSRQAKTVMSSLRFNGREGSGAYSFCFQGYRNGSNVFVESVSEYSRVTHPDDLSGYSVKLCGYTAYQDSHDGNSYVVLQSQNINYIITDLSPQGLPSVGRSYVSASNGAESCYYGQSAPTVDYNRTHKKFFKALAVDLGNL